MPGNHRIGFGHAVGIFSVFFHDVVVVAAINENEIKLLIKAQSGHIQCGAVLQNLAHFTLNFCPRTCNAARALLCELVAQKFIIRIAVFEHIAHGFALQRGELFWRNVERDHIGIGWCIFGQQQGGGAHEGAKFKQASGLGQLGQTHQHAAFKQGHAANIRTGYVHREAHIVVWKACFNGFEQYFGANGLHA